MKKKRYGLLALLLVLVLLGSGGCLLWKQLDYAKGAQDYEAAIEAAGVPKKVTPSDQQAGVSQQPPDVSQRESDPYAEALAGIDLDALRETNSDVIAWIMIPETELNYPVVQEKDNAFYLNHTWTRSRSSAGGIFMECKCSSDFSDYNTIIYGHRMNNESMFGTLRRYDDVDFWRAHPRVYVVTDSGVHIYDIFASCEVGIREIVYRLDIEESALEQEFIDFCLEQSVIDTGIVPTAEEQVLTLSTCPSRGHATRWIVQAVLRR